MTVDQGAGPELLLDVRGLTVEYAGGRGRPPFRAVNDVSLSVAKGETVGVVGESGSGKSTVGRAILGLTPVHSGQIVFDGEEITNIAPRRRRALTSELQVVFQDPYSSLNPARTVGQTLAEGLRVHRELTREQVAGRVGDLLERVGMPREAASRYPGRFSGGQRQRIAIARALMVQPRLIICDEPTSALDLSVQAQVLNLLRELQDDLGLSYLFIAHDLDVVKHLCDRLVVMRWGEVVEEGGTREVTASPATDYTRALLEAAPVPDPRRQRERRLQRQSRAGRADG